MSARPDPVVIRLARPTDATELRRLAQRDSAGLPRHPVLVAELAGGIRAAVSLDGGMPIADPFHQTAALVELLSTRAAQLRSAPARSDRSWRQALRRGRRRHRPSHRPAAARVA
jgi:hypothetical protein